MKTSTRISRLSAAKLKAWLKTVKLAQSRIEAGIKLMDKKFGRLVWLEKIDESKLRLASGTMCVTGQAYEDNWDGFLDEMRDGGAKDPYAKGIKYGFYLEDDTAKRKGMDYDLLTRLWHARISEMKIISGLPLKTPPPIN